MLSIFTGSQALLEGLAGRVTATSVVELSKGLPDVVLGEGGAHVNGHIDAPVDGFWILSSVNSPCSKPRMREGEIF